MSAGVLRYTVVRRNPDTLESVALLAGQPVPEWAEDLVHSDDYEPGTGTDNGTGSDSGPTVEDLKAEIDKRNEGRDDDKKLSKSGKKAELLAALAADDAAQSE